SNATDYRIGYDCTNFYVPADMVVDCGQLTDLNFTGRPTLVMDNCTASPTVNYEDVFTAGSCASGGAIQRIWRVQDEAGNTTEKIQSHQFG
ncbi:MAG: hypothetical protein HC912_10220, partial [Saprospiraceae bacterium]|nr:hypothetical protein [Saprospiraceae bacterium]